MSDAVGRASWLLFLLPVFVTVGFARLISSLPGLSDFELTLFCFATSAINVVVALGVYHVVLILARRTQLLPDLWQSPLWWTVTVTVSILTGVLLAVAYEQAWANRTIKAILPPFTLAKVSPHSALRELLPTTIGGKFDDVRAGDLQSQDGEQALRVQIQRREERLLGFARGWSGISAEGEGELYLAPVCLESGGSVTQLPGAGAWVPLSSVDRIDFLDPEEISCLQDQLAGS